MDRYHRQILLPQIGSAGQARLAAARVLLVGCGALGTVLAEQLVRAGVGFLRLCDRDVVERTNLQRQVLFTEGDAADGVPKAVAAGQRLRQVNSEVEIDARVVDVEPGNLEQLAGVDGRDGARKVDLLLDGTDNAEVRYLINDVAVKHGIPWVYGACIGTEGRVMPVRPGVTPCLRCVFPDPPNPGELPTCDTAGVLAPAAGVVASLEAAAAIRLLVAGEASAQLTTLDVWTNRIRAVDLSDARRPNCPACGQRRFEFLDRASTDTASLCGRNAVQVRPSQRGARLDVESLARRLAAVGTVQRTPHLIRCAVEGGSVSLTVFPDGRALIQGTGDPARARGIYAKYVGA